MVFRIKKPKDYTVMSNHHLRNVVLSLKAKGLLSLMLSLPDTWDYSLNGLASICGDGVSSISTGIKELEKEGYVTREQSRNASGQMGTVDYIVREVPLSESPISTPLPPQGEEPFSENHRQSNTKELSIKESITNQSNGKQDKNLTDLTDQVKTQIDYSLLVENHKKELIDLIVEIMIETYIQESDTFYQGKTRYQTSQMQKQLETLEYKSLTYWLENDFYKITEPIRYLKSYLMRAFYTLDFSKAMSWKNQPKQTESTASYGLEALEEMITHSSIWD